MRRVPGALRAAAGVHRARRGRRGARRRPTIARGHRRRPRAAASAEADARRRAARRRAGRADRARSSRSARSMSSSPGTRADVLITASGADGRVRTRIALRGAQVVEAGAAPAGGGGGGRRAAARRARPARLAARRRAPRGGAGRGPRAARTAAPALGIPSSSLAAGLKNLAVWPIGAAMPENTMVPRRRGLVAPLALLLTFAMARSPMLRAPRRRSRRCQPLKVEIGQTLTVTGKHFVPGKSRTRSCSSATASPPSSSRSPTQATSTKLDGRRADEAASTS